jgi:hypothetical protein
LNAKSAAAAKVIANPTRGCLRAAAGGAGSTSSDTARG